MQYSFTVFFNIFLYFFYFIYSYFENVLPAWIRRIEFFFDNAGKTNKNNFILIFLTEMIRINKFDSIMISFMIVGHTKVNFFYIFIFLYNL